MTNIGEDEVVHDVLAADEFAVPAPDEFQHSGPVVLPEDPTGEPAPHDILAAEDFAMPAPEPLTGSRGRPRSGSVTLYAGIAALIAVLVLLRRRSSSGS